MGDVVGAEGVKLCRVGKDNGQHSDAFQQVEHAKAAYSAGLGAFHEKGPSLRRPETGDQQAHTVKNDPFIRI